MAKSNSKITKTLVDNAKPPATGDAWMWDSELEGFGIRIQASGRKTYVIRYRTRDAARTQRKMTVGKCSNLAPDRARDLARKYLAQVADGKDPANDFKPKPKKEKAATVKRMFEGYIDYMRSKGRVSADDVERQLLRAKNSAVAALGPDRLASDVTPRDVVDFVSTFYDKGHRSAADKARSYIASSFAWAIRSANDYTVRERLDWGLVRNPAADVAKDPGAISARDRNLSVEEMRQLWADLDPGRGIFSPNISAAIQLSICCGQRVLENLRLEGSEIDLAKGLWAMPPQKSKIHRAHLVPLPRQAIDLLTQQVNLYGTGILFPPKAGTQRTFMCYNGVNQALKKWQARPDVNVPPFQARDLRRTWKSRTHDAGIDRFTRDLIQQHAKSDTGSKHYDRADYVPIMRDAMKKWSDWLDQHVI